MSPAEWSLIVEKGLEVGVASQLNGMPEERCCDMAMGWCRTICELPRSFAYEISDGIDGVPSQNSYHPTLDPWLVSNLSFYSASLRFSRPLPQNPDLQRPLKPRREAVLPFHIALCGVDELEIKAAEGMGNG